MNRRDFGLLPAVLSLLAVLLITGCGSDSTTAPGGDDDPSGPRTWYVDNDAIGTGSGRSWGNAFIHPSDAMDAASAGDQIWVAESTFYGPGNRHEPVVAFKAGVALYGGFAGGETDLSQRDHHDRATFSGGDTLYHVVTGADSALLHGIRVARGRATNLLSDPEMRGGGIYCLNAKMRIARCNISQCEAYLGAGIYAEGDTVVIDSCQIDDNLTYQADIDEAGGGGISIMAGRAEIDACSIIYNTSGNNGGGLLLYNSSADVSRSTICENSLAGSDNNGGGIYVYNGEALELITDFSDCTICVNTATRGGGIATELSNIEFRDCNFHTNEATAAGSALFLHLSSFRMEHCIVAKNGVSALHTLYHIGSTPRIFNCLFYSNGDSEKAGGAIFNNAASIEIEFCTFAYNKAREGAGIYNVFPIASLTVTNSILWGNNSTVGSPQIQNISGATATVTYTDIDQDGFFPIGTNNMRSDPLFAISGFSGYYYLSHTAAGQNYDSPCIDMGNSAAVSHGLDSRTTRTDDVFDAGMADLGFHHKPGP